MLTTEHRALKRKRTGPISSDVVSKAGLGSLSGSGDSIFGEITPLFAIRLRQCVVSLASFVEGTMVFRSTGMLISPGSCGDATSVLTSASLVRSPDDESKIIENLTIKVRLPDDLVVIGWLHHYDLAHDLAVINIERLLGFLGYNFSSRCQEPFKSDSRVVCLGRCFDSGMLTTTSGTEIGRVRDELCKLDEAFFGGPLFAFRGSLAGMNCCHGGKVVFLPRDKIVERLEHFGIRTDINQERHRTKEPDTVSRKIDYPVPDKFINDYMFGMHVVNSFEDKFEGDIWSALSKELASNLSECVVSLASYNGNTRHFACTGVFIECYPARILTSASLVRTSDDKSKIHDDLRIEVRFQNKSRVIATLKYYDLCYNVAVVEIIHFCSACTIPLEKDIPFTPNIDVVAVGCCFKDCEFMATKGVLVDKLTKLDCKALGTSTCTITKAGIGVPLIDTYGNYVGMNFYEEEETPYLPRKKNLGALEAI